MTKKLTVFIVSAVIGPILLALAACGSKPEPPAVPDRPVKPVKVENVSVLRPGDMVMDPNQEDHARLLLLDGWNTKMDGTAGKKYLWGVGKHSSFRFYVEKPEMGGTLAFIAYPFRPKTLPPQAIDVSVNGQPAGKIELEMRERSYSLKIPATALVKGENKFEFFYAYSACPFELGLGPDKRFLAALFKKISFVPDVPVTTTSAPQNLKPLKPGDVELDPNSAGNPRRMLLEGWSDKMEGPAGKKYVWAIGRRSGFRFFVDKPDLGGTILFVTYPYLGKGLSGQAVELFANGRSAGRVSLEKKEKRYSIKVPAALLKAGENRFEFAFAYSTSPLEQGVSKDKRSLSALFKKIAIVP